MIDISESTWLIGCITATLVVGITVVMKTRRSPWDYLDGPPSNSFLLGHQRDFMRGEVGRSEFGWLEKYGSVYPYRGVLGETKLFISDPKAMQFVWGTPATGHTFIRPSFFRAFLKDLGGPGIVWSHGQDHTRHRRIMMPAFNAPQIKALLPIFNGACERLVQTLKEDIGSAESKVENIHRWLALATLDVIGEAAFDYRFGALTKDSNELTAAYHNLLQDSVANPTDGFILFSGILASLPEFIISIFRKMPLKRFERIRSCRNVVDKTARELLNKKLMSGEDGSKDVMTLLVKANMAAEDKAKLSEEEVMSQMMTIMGAGHETTSNSTSWALFELAKDLGLQMRLREEIRRVREEAMQKGEAELTTGQLDQMELLGAIVKETLRYHPVVYHTHREATMDTVIPLAKPIKTKSGHYISEIPIKKGQGVTLGEASFQRTKSYWGEDANVFRPERWFEKGRPVTGLGVFADLMTFASGHRACLGWRFSVMEMQCLLVELISNFELSIPEGSKRIVRDSSVVMSPVVEGERGAQLPLLVRPLEI